MEIKLFKRTFVGLFLYILCLHAVAIFVFAWGFLLTRTELPLSSQCPDAQRSPCRLFSQSNSSLSKDYVISNATRTIPQSSCWTKPAVERVVIIVFDALRFDFVAPSRFFKEPKPWMDKLQVLQKLASEKPFTTRIFKAIADPPTTSLQRLKGLTTGGLPTFIDVGNSFGASEITEDNLINQLIKQGKRVIMMGDDTWLQVFPNHFTEAYPFPSFNVKDLDTVDDGVVEHMFPALYRDDWDVLIAHFLGVDHAGHIFGVESPQMIKKLEQYNDILEEVVSILNSHVGSGGLHENTLLIVLGDHGQTLNGDHGGGTAEEIETAIFAMSMNQQSRLVTSKIDNLLCIDKSDNICISTLPQLDFAATIAGLIGVPIPFGSIGRVNSELYVLGSGLLFELNDKFADISNHCSAMQLWFDHLMDVLCVNSWQVKRYIDVYSESSIIGFSPNDLFELQTIYHQVQKSYFETREKLASMVDSSENAYCGAKVSIMKNQVDAFTHYLEDAAELARLKWTQFDLKMMILGVSISIIVLLVQLAALLMVRKLLSLYSEDQYTLVEEDLTVCFPWRKLFLSGLLSSFLGTLCYPLFYSVSKNLRLVEGVASLKKDWVIVATGTSATGSAICFLVNAMLYLQRVNKLVLFQGKHLQYKEKLTKFIIPVMLVIVRACSFLSNSYILVEGRVLLFLLASTGMMFLRHALEVGSMVPKAFLFLILNFFIGIMGQNLSSKDTTNILDPQLFSYTIYDSIHIQLAINILLTLIPLTIVFLIASFWLQAKGICLKKMLCCVTYTGFFLSCIFMMLHWFMADISLVLSLDIPNTFRDFTRLLLPRVIYLLTAGQIVFLFCKRIPMFEGSMSGFLSDTSRVTVSAVGMMLAWFPSVLLLLGKHSPLIALLAILQVWCILDMQTIPQKSKEYISAKVDVIDFMPVLQWNFLAMQLFFSTGHRCTFDGLHYGAAFIGFDNFHIIQQGVLLALNTFGISYILPILGLPLLVLKRHLSLQRKAPQDVFILELVQVFLMYGLVTASMTTLSTICVMIHRRHLMVWGLFAPKYVFEIVGLLLTDVLIALNCHYYF